MLSAMELFDLEEGEILVTEATSPNWTPAFAIIGACVCDGGGSLTHAATVSREYGIPCVVGTSVATLRIKTGDIDRGRRHEGHRHDRRARRAADRLMTVAGKRSSSPAAPAASAPSSRPSSGRAAPRWSRPTSSTAPTSLRRQRCGAVDAVFDRARRRSTGWSTTPALLVSRKTPRRDPARRVGPDVRRQRQGHVPVRPGGGAGT